MTTTLVTGATGFLGGALVDRLLARGYAHDGNVLRLTYRAGSPRARVEAAIARHPGARVEWIACNLANAADAQRAVDGVDVILHLAATLRGAPADMFLSTVVGSQHLIDAIDGRDLRVVLVSSFSVYGVASQGRGALVDEATPLEPHPDKRDPYAQVKLRQEELFREAARIQNFELVVVRPGVIYGPGGSAFSSRVGLALAGRFLFLGGRNVLPLTYVDNCADAIITCAYAPRAAGETYNIVDDELPTCAQYLHAYEHDVHPVRTVRVPYRALLLLSSAVERYHAYSHGQLPAIFTPYKVRSTWAGNRFSNAKLHGLGWTPAISTNDGLRRTFATLRAKEAAA